jgi:predicted GTPase
MYNYKPLILCSFKDFSAENISFKIDEIERFQKSSAWESPKLRSIHFSAENISFKIDEIERFQKVHGVGKSKRTDWTLFSRKYFV